MTFDLTVNGQRHTFPSPMTVEDLISHFQLSQQRVAVERNRQIVPREVYACTALSTGDELEIVTLVGGG